MSCGEAGSEHQGHHSPFPPHQWTDNFGNATCTKTFIASFCALCPQPGHPSAELLLHPRESPAITSHISEGIPDCTLPELPPQPPSFCHLCSARLHISLILEPPSSLAALGPLREGAPLHVPGFLAPSRALGSLINAHQQ